MKFLNKETLKSWLGTPELFLIDVRSPQAFAQSIAKIEQAHRIDPAKLPNLAPDLPKDRKLVLYCEDGKTECPNVARQLRKLGFKEVFVLKGGWQTWYGKEYPAVPKELDY